MTRALSLLAALAALAAHACAPRPALDPEGRFPAADTSRIVELVPGVRHAYLWFEEGPWAVHVVEMDERLCRPAIAAAKAGPPLAERATTTDLAGDALAAINADFFMLPRGTPVGGHVRAGRVLAGPGARPLYVLDQDGRHRSGPARLHGFAAVGGDTAIVLQVNRAADAGFEDAPTSGLALYDAWFGDALVAAAGRSAIRVRAMADGLGVVVGGHHGPEDGAPLDGDHLALEARGEAAAAWLDRRAAGDTVVWHVRVVPTAAGPGPAPALEAVGGFPVLVADGRGRYHEHDGISPGFGEARHPRTAVGWDDAGRRLLWVVVDGRQPGYSEGMSLPELERLFLDLGATHAINLDGGGSTTLVVEGAVANRPSDIGGERAVANALVLQGCLRKDEG